MPNEPATQNLSQPPADKKKWQCHKIPNPTTRKSHILNSRVPGSFNGRTGAFEASNPGSNPGPGANRKQVQAGLFAPMTECQLFAFDSHVDSHMPENW
jgi:hypothetical protein